MILAVQSYPGGNDTVARHYPYWAKCGFYEIWGIGTTDGGCRWPDGMKSTVIGRNSYIEGDHLCRRLTETIAFILSLPGWNSAAIMEYDVVTFSPFPEPTGVGLMAVASGGPTTNNKATYFYHCPWIATREGWKELHAACLDLLRHNEIESGSPDIFIGWAAQKHNIPILAGLKRYSQNSITVNEPNWVHDARRARLDGWHAVHGIKSKAVLDRIMA